MKNNTTSSSSTAQPASESNLQADSPLDVASCSASSFRYGHVDGIPLGNYGTTGRDGFRVSFMGGSENKFWISLVDENGYSTATLSSNYQGLLQLRHYLNSAYEFLHHPESP